MSSRYNQSIFIQTKRVINPAQTDVVHTMTTYDNLDNLANKWYDDPTLSWVIMCANPQYSLEFEIKHGDKVRIPLPITRVWSAWSETNDI